ncbi:MAG TPA: hypothetical protein VJM75_06310 [Acidimicrobiales bacterium]|jgi:hypothetical protein|nr:hypothetical protein [Acidimicrobiales bacterium]
MFSIHCPHHRTRVLLGPRAIESLDNTADGVILHWRCYCGARGAQRYGREPAGARRIPDPFSTAA